MENRNSNVAITICLCVCCKPKISYDSRVFEFQEETFTGYVVNSGCHFESVSLTDHAKLSMCSSEQNHQLYLSPESMQCHSL